MLTKIFKYTFLTFMVLSILIIFTHNVSKDISEEDAIYIKKFISNIEIEDEIKLSNFAKSLSYNEQIQTIKTIQDNLLTIVSKEEGIPHNQTREPKDLFEKKSGLCFDRSFVLEKIFSSLGFKTRHVAIYEDRKELNWFQEMTTPQIASHAISEVKTKKGWIIVDSNYRWIGLDKNNNPVSMDQLNENPKLFNTWLTEPPTPTFPFYKKNGTHFYGLYSRHGRFYKPYNFIPDFRFQELLYNL